MACSPEDHIYRKGYYMGSEADFVCFLCGEEASAAELDDEPAAVAHSPTALAPVPADVPTAQLYRRVESYKLPLDVTICLAGRGLARTRSLHRGHQIA